MTYCHVPWTNIDISPQGEISPCCKFKNSNYQYRTPNINEVDINDYTSSQILTEVKKDFTNGVWPKGCERCKIEEENGIESKRIQDEIKYQEYLTDHRAKGFLSASIAFGNTCNLTCITCDPSSSSKWYQEYKTLYGKSIKPNLFYKKDFVDNFYSFANNLVQLDIPGGEPFLSGVNEQKQLLEKFVKDGKAKDITLHYFTNCTKFIDDSWLSLWKYFKLVDLQLSIDGIQNRFEYIRYPAIWSEVESNAFLYRDLAKTYNNIKISISTTVSAYNIFYLDELLEWANTNGFSKPYLGRVHNPKHLRPTVWRNNAKIYIIEKLLESKFNLSSFVTLVKNEDDSKHFEDFRYRLLRHDQYRNLSFKSTFPEMFTFLAE